MTFMSSAPSSFAFQPHEKVEQGFVRVLEQLAIQARRLTQHAHRILPESVHDTRVLIKYLQALLWFARPAFSSSEMNRANSHLRKASHLLAAQRELVVIRSILKKLSRKTANPAYRNALARIVNALDSRQAMTKTSDQPLRQAAAILLKTIKHIKLRAKINSRWPSPSDRLAQAFLATKKSGEKALANEDATRFHDWRKKAKRLLYQLQLTQAVPGKRMRHTINQVDKLQEKLGDYHDCVIAQNRLQRNLFDEVTPRVVRHTVDLLQERKHRLRKKVRKIARHIKLR